jgi:ketosteroid isomerase-like protein
MSRAIRMLVLVLVLALPAADAASPPAATPEQVVRAFNAAISARRLDAALALLAPGAVNFSLESAHAFTTAPGAAVPLTADLATHWRTVGPVLFSMHRRYQREVDAATTHQDGQLAMVWTRLRTTSELQRGDATLLVFSEAYLLRREAGAWRIAGVANSRHTR